MKRVDIFGVPGSGKSAISNELESHRRWRDGWMTQGQAKKKLGLTDNFSNPVALNSQEYKELINLACRYVGESRDDSLLKLMRLIWLVRDIESLSVMEKGDITETVVFEESLSQRFFTWLLIGDTMNDFKHMLKLLPLPDAFIYCYADQAIIAERLHLREKVALQHKFLSTEEIMSSIKTQSQYFEVGAKTLEELGVRGLSLDTSNSLERNLEIVKKFITSI